jgi:hypothetical protein
VPSEPDRATKVSVLLGCRPDTVDGWTGGSSRADHECSSPFCERTVVLTSFTAWSPPTPADLVAVKERVYDPCGFVCADLSAEAESAAYGAHVFRLDGAGVRARVAKLTPTKNGLFVTVWKRLAGGPIQPFDRSDGIDFLVVTAREGPHSGHFAFPGEVLHRRGIVGSAAGEGKRAFRVYPPWTVTESAQAARTAAWQRPYFLPFDEAGTADLHLARALYASA